jgi:hypothetical protein
MFAYWLVLRFSREYFTVSKSSLTFLLFGRIRENSTSREYFTSCVTVSLCSRIFVLFDRIRENSTSREYFASCVTVSLCSRIFVLFGRIRETSISRKYAAAVSVALGLNSFPRRIRRWKAAVRMDRSLTTFQ